MRGVQPHDIQPDVHHVRQDSDVIGRGTDGRHYLGSSQHGSAASALLESGDGGQRLTFHELEEGAAAR